MQNRHEHNSLTWIDLESPTSHEVREVAAEFGIDALSAEELLSPSARPIAEFHERYVYLILRFPALKHTHQAREQEIDFLIGRDFLITAHYETVDTIHKFAKVFEVNSLLEKGMLEEHGGTLFYALLRKLYKSVEHELEHIRKEQHVIEEHIFSGHEVRMVEAISRVARDLLSIRQIIEPHRDMLRSLQEGGAQLFGSEFTPFLKALENDYFRVHGHVMRSIESLHELRETNNSLLTTKQNETMRVFTIMAFLTFPLSLLVALLDVNALGNPIQNMDNGFWIILGSVVVVGALMVGIFKRNGWL